MLHSHETKTNATNNGQSSQWDGRVIHSIVHKYRTCQTKEESLLIDEWELSVFFYSETINLSIH